MRSPSCRAQGELHPCPQFTWPVEGSHRPPFRECIGGLRTPEVVGLDPQGVLAAFQNRQGTGGIREQCHWTYLCFLQQDQQRSGQGACRHVGCLLRWPLRCVGDSEFDASSCPRRRQILQLRGVIGD